MDITWIPLIQYGSPGVHLVKKWPKVVKKWHFWAITAKPKSTFLPLECQGRTAGAVVGGQMVDLGGGRMDGVSTVPVNGGMGSGCRKLFVDRWKESGGGVHGSHQWELSTSYMRHRWMGSRGANGVDRMKGRAAIDRIHRRGMSMTYGGRRQDLSAEGWVAGMKGVCGWMERFGRRRRREPSTPSMCDGVMGIGGRRVSTYGQEEMGSRGMGYDISGVDAVFGSTESGDMQWDVFGKGDVDSVHRWVPSVHQASSYSWQQVVERVWENVVHLWLFWVGRHFMSTPQPKKLGDFPSFLGRTYAILARISTLTGDYDGERAILWRKDAAPNLLSYVLGTTLNKAETVVHGVQFQEDINSHLLEIAGFRVAFPTPAGEKRITYVQAYTTNKSLTYHKQGFQHSQSLTGTAAMTGHPPKYCTDLTAAYMDAKQKNVAARLEVRLPLEFAVDYMLEFDDDVLRPSIVAYAHECNRSWCLVRMDAFSRLLSAMNDQSSEQTVTPSVTSTYATVVWMVNGVHSCPNSESGGQACRDVTIPFFEDYYATDLLAASFNDSLTEIEEEPIMDVGPDVTVQQQVFEDEGQPERTVEQKVQEIWAQFPCCILQKIGNPKGSGTLPSYCRIPQQDRQNVMINIMKETNLAKVFVQIQVSSSTIPWWCKAFEVCFPPKGHTMPKCLQTWTHMHYYMDWKTPVGSLQPNDADTVREALWHEFKNLTWIPCATSERPWRTDKQPLWTQLPPLNEPGPFSVSNTPGPQILWNPFEDPNIVWDPSVPLVIAPAGVALQVNGVTPAAQVADEDELSGDEAQAGALREISAANNGLPGGPRGGRGNRQESADEAHKPMIWELSRASTASSYCHGQPDRPSVQRPRSVITDFALPDLFAPSQNGTPGRPSAAPEGSLASNNRGGSSARDRASVVGSQHGYRLLAGPGRLTFSPQSLGCRSRREEEEEGEGEGEGSLKQGDIEPEPKRAKVARQDNNNNNNSNVEMMGMNVNMNHIVDIEALKQEEEDNKLLECKIVEIGNVDACRDSNTLTGLKGSGHGLPGCPQRQGEWVEMAMLQLDWVVVTQATCMPAEARGVEEGRRCHRSHLGAHTVEESSRGEWALLRASRVPMALRGMAEENTTVHPREGKPIVYQSPST
ncbi:hypothetical protein BDN71DRAFT_1436975 [Pleurotus eryngii]|uniref:Uncharacterized protein n=1 Tax=Pleurotus eryngii TaxID=5323 RepID=A0A9P5ZIK5_PLEER|nr:hypothetical protein BDN71DRAFT_1436975 [Pleurotus eryngii]